MIYSSLVSRTIELIFTDETNTYTAKGSVNALI